MSKSTAVFPKEPPLYVIPCEVEDATDVSQIKFKWRETLIKCLVRQAHDSAAFAVKIDKVIRITNPSKGVFFIEPEYGNIEGFSHVTFNVFVHPEKAKDYLKRDPKGTTPFLVEVKVEVDPLNMGLLSGALPPLIATTVNKATKKPQVSGKARIGIQIPPPWIWSSELPTPQSKMTVNSAEGSGSRCSINLLQYNKQAEKYEAGNEELEIVPTKNNHKVQFEPAQIDASGFSLRTKRVIIGSRLIDARDSLEKAGEIAISRKTKNKPPAGNQPMKVFVDYQPSPSATISVKFFVKGQEKPLGVYEHLEVNGERVQIIFPKLPPDIEGRIVWKVTGSGRVLESGSGFQTEEMITPLASVKAPNGEERLGATIDIVRGPLTEAHSPIYLDAETPYQYKLKVRTQGDKTILRADGEDALWVDGEVECNNPEVDTTALTSRLIFKVEGPNADWLHIGPLEMTEQSTKSAPVRAQRPSPNARLLEGGPMVAVITQGPLTLRGSVQLRLELLPAKQERCQALLREFNQYQDREQAVISNFYQRQHATIKLSEKLEEQLKQLYPLKTQAVAAYKELWWASIWLVQSENLHKYPLWLLNAVAGMGTVLAGLSTPLKVAGASTLLNGLFAVIEDTLKDSSFYQSTFGRVVVWRLRLAQQAAQRFVEAAKGLEGGRDSLIQTWLTLEPAYRTYLSDLKMTNQTLSTMHYQYEQQLWQLRLECGYNDLHLLRSSPESFEDKIQLYRKQPAYEWAVSHLYQAGPGGIFGSLGFSRQAY
jgi:hypothetical protein